MSTSLRVAKPTSPRAAAPSSCVAPRPPRAAAPSSLGGALALALVAGCGAPLEPPGAYRPPPPHTMTIAVPGSPSRSAPDSPPLIPRDLDDTFYIDLASVRATLHFVTDTAHHVVGGSFVRDGGAADPIDHVTWSSGTGALTFRRAGAESTDWFRVRVVEGVLAGRVAHGLPDAPAPQVATAYDRHVTGWSGPVFDGALTPRVYELALPAGRHARVRIDRDDAHGGALVGRFKVYATDDDGAAAEQQEYDIAVDQWDGTYLAFRVTDPAYTSAFVATVIGNRITGSYTRTDAPGSWPFAGMRAEVLSHGLDPRSVAERNEWQRRTRRALEHLLMAGNPVPLSTTVNVIAADRPPIPSQMWLPNRDDNPDNWPQSYRLTELAFEHTLPNPYGGAPIVRKSHGYLAVPTVPPPPGGFSAVVGVNGHGGSAHAVLDPDHELYWYGDAFARRGNVVVAVDVGHRPVADRGGVYPDYEYGDDPQSGNGLHPSIHADGLDSDWEEDGERVFDVMRALDFVRGRGDVNPARVTVAGLSMGGEITTLVSALDPDVSMVVAAGYSPDLGVVEHNGNHGCWQWAHGDVREYVDASDYHALIAPRPLLVETGKADHVYSAFWAPFAADKQVLRRSRAAYDDAPGNIVHYLHYDAHHFHFGDVDPVAAVESGVRVPTLVRPDVPGSLGWQTDATTQPTAPTLFDAIARFFVPS